MRVCSNESNTVTHECCRLMCVLQRKIAKIIPLIKEEREEKNVHLCTSRQQHDIYQMETTKCCAECERFADDTCVSTKRWKKGDEEKHSCEKVIYVKFIIQVRLQPALEYCQTSTVELSFTYYRQVQTQVRIQWKYVRGIRNPIFLVVPIRSTRVSDTRVCARY